MLIDTKEQQKKWRGWVEALLDHTREMNLREFKLLDSCRNRLRCGDGLNKLQTVELESLFKQLCKPAKVEEKTSDDVDKSVRDGNSVAVDGDTSTEVAHNRWANALGGV